MANLATNTADTVTQVAGLSTITYGEETPLVFRVWNKSGLPIGQKTAYGRVLGAHLRLLQDSEVPCSDVTFRDAFGNTLDSANGVVNIIGTTPRDYARVWWV